MFSTFRKTILLFGQKVPTEVVRKKWLNPINNEVGHSIFRTFVCGRNQLWTKKIEFPPLISTGTARATRIVKEQYRRELQNDEGTEGESSFDLDFVDNNEEYFPNVNTPNELFDGIPFKNLPIINIYATKNNTKFLLDCGKGKTRVTRSCGRDGFKNARKRTNVAAQTTAQVFGSECVKMGYKTVRLRVSGLGAGRSSSLKGLTLAGVNIISITDFTKVSLTPRPRKVRRL